MSKRNFIMRSVLLFGILPAVSFIVSRFALTYDFDVTKIDTDFVGTAFGITTIFLLIGYFAGLRGYSVKENK